MKRSVFFVLFVSSLCYATAQNLVVNPGLETWESATKPTGWSLAQACVMESSLIHSGNHSCVQSAGTDSRDLNQSIMVEPGKEYSFSVYYMTGVTSAGNGGRIWCKWLNSGADVTDAASKDIMQTGYLTSSSWHQYSFTVVAPPNANTFLLQVRTLPNSISYWDDFIFEESIATGFNDDTRKDPEIYPVPAHNDLFINNAYGIKSIEILNLSGTHIKSFNAHADSDIRIDVADLRKGFYVLRLRYERRIEVRKFIKD